MPRPGRVIVVGSVNVDQVVTVERLPTAGQTVTGGTFARHHGGKGANQAVAAARAGAQVRFVGAVGDDDLGRAALADLRREGVDTTGVVVDPDRPTGVALIVVAQDGENQIAVASGANAALDPGPALARVAPGQDVLLLGFEVAPSAIDTAAAVARQRGWRVVCDPAPPRELSAPLLACHPVLTPNTGEAEALTGLADPAAAARTLHERTGAPAIVTRGERPVLVCDEDGLREIDVEAVQAVDSTGAGDTFAGVLAALLAEDAPLDEAIALAARGASRSTATPGARDGMPTRAQLSEAAADLGQQRR